ncbi:TatD family hydrolase, partial [Gammaproteobacteria bacterium]|nr:TatD family hydrolase [Gammaproteobacteria bacterium]
MYFDSHCHLDRIDLEGFDNDLDNLLQTIAEGDVTRLLCIGVDLESFDAMQRLIEPYDHVFCSAGVHPDYADASEPSVEILCELAERDKVVAIGETGLDYFHQSGDLDWQRLRFITHIEAARNCGLPLIVHTRDAREDTLALLRQHKADEVGGVLH